jgi:hypothetical protein
MTDYLKLDKGSGRLNCALRIGLASNLVAAISTGRTEAGFTASSSTVETSFTAGERVEE